MNQPQTPFSRETESSTQRVECVRCHHELEEYSFARLPLQPYGSGDGHVMLECPKCGHVEFLSRTSPLVGQLQAIPTYVGDGD